MTIPPYPPDHFSILTPEMQRDWWRDRCLELLEYAEHQMASPEMIHCSKLYSECGCGLDALSKAILEANK